MAAFRSALPFSDGYSVQLFGQRTIRVSESERTLARRTKHEEQKTK